MNDLKERITKILDDDKSMKFMRIKKILTLEDIEFLDANYKDSVTLEEKVYLFFYNKKREDFKCTCGKQTGFHTLRRGFNKVCSMQCHGRNTSEHIVKASKDKALPVLTKKCVVCGEEFETKLVKRIACSHKCGAIYNHSIRTDEQKKAIDSKRKKTCLDKYGDEHVVNSRYTREKTKEKLGVEYPWQSIHVRKNFIEAMVEKYGVDNPMKIEEVRDRMIATKIAKYGGLDTFNHYKDYVFPSGRIDKVQGYEPMALDILLQSHSEEDIVTGKSITAMTGPFKYFSDITGRWHYYYPDIFIVSENRIIEVKSKWTYEKQIETNQLKKLAVEERGFTFEFIIF